MHSRVRRLPLQLQQQDTIAQAGMLKALNGSSTHGVGDVGALEDVSEVRLLEVVVDRPHNHLNVALLKEVNHFSTTLTRHKRSQPPATRTVQ